MKRGISINRDYDYQGIPCVVIKKKRGKLTLPEITDTLHYGDRQCWGRENVRQNQTAPGLLCSGHRTWMRSI